MPSPFSVLLSVYRNDNPEHFRTAVESISLKQTLRPSEIIIVVDGPVTEPINKVLESLCKEIPEIKTVRLEKNSGLGNALRIGMTKATNEIVARMDADDIASPDRFAKQISYISNNPDCSILGGQITEFIDSPDNVVGKREVPCSDSEIQKLIKSRCPFNHMTVVLRKGDVLRVGNYIDWHFNEDYYLWIRMAEAGYKFANLPDTLVNVRVGKEMYARRGGWKYFKSEKGLQDYMRKKKVISFPQYLFNVAVRFGVQVAMPNSLRGFLFKTLFRKK